jgi:hypothetical protein
MSYIGSTPTTQSFISGTDYFNGDGATVAFTLSRSVGSVNDIEVLVNNVEQQPNTVYTVLGITLTFTTAPSSGTQNIYVRYLSTTTQVVVPSQGTVNTAQLGLITTIPTTGGNTITVPASTGTMALTSQLPVVVAGPAFSAYLSTGSVVTGSAAWLKVPCNTKEFDTASCYDNATNYRFTPTIAGYYQVNGCVQNTSGANGQYISIYKNGTIFKKGSANASADTSVVGALIYLNGTTDYVELWSYNSPQTFFVAGASSTYFQASLVRTA